MKFIVFKANTRGKQPNKRDYRLSFERLLFILFILTFSLLIIIQTALINPSTRTFLTSDSELEGTPMGVEEFFYEEGSVSLSLLGEEPNPELKVLVNGEAVAAFDEMLISVDVKDGDVVEIDGSSSGTGAGVEVVSKSDNIKTQCVGKKVSVKGNIKKVTDINID